MTDFYETLLQATNNIDDITNEKYATVTKVAGDYCSVQEEDTLLEHSQVPILNKITCETGDKVVLGFVNNSLYDPVIIGNLSRKISGGSGGSYINDFYGDSSTNELVIDYDTNVSQADIVASWSSTTSDTKVPSEKLTKDTLDTKQDLLISGTTIKTINSTSILGSGNISVGGGSSVDIVTSWESPLSDIKVASEKLVKDTIDTKANSSHTHTVSNITDFPTIPTKVSDLNNDTGFITSSSLPTKVSDLTNDTGFITSSSLPTKTSDLRNDGDGTNAFLTQHQSLTNYVQKSNTNGLIRNDGSIDTNTYLTQHQSLTGYLQTTDVVDNLTSTSTTAPLSAKQGKVLNDLIGSAITYIIGSGS